LPSEGVERRLTAILAADVAGYSRLVEADEEGTLAQWKAHCTGLIEPTIKKHHGRIVRVIGDGLLVEFTSVIDALRCAVEVQRGMVERNADVPSERRIEFRMGINFGELIIDGGDFWGDGVNIAARLEALAEPGGISVSGRVQEDAQGKLDITFDDTGEQQLKNIMRPVRVYRVRFDGAAKSAPELPLPSKPSIAVLAFQNMSGDPEQEYFADGIAEDIITMLSRSHSLFVIARNSSFTYKGRAVDVKQVGRELGVRYVLEGSVRRGGNRVRITAQLVDAVTGNHLWAERYDRDLTDIFVIQDEITEAIAIVIEPTIAQMERFKASRKPPHSLGAWEAYQRGLWHLAHVGADELKAAMGFFRRAIELDPNFASAYAQLTLTIASLVLLYATTSIEQAIKEIGPLVEKATSLDRTDVHAYLARFSLPFLRGDREDALAAAQEAVGFSPNNPLAHWDLATALMMCTRYREAIASLKTSMRLDPKIPSNYLRMSAIAQCHYLMKEYDVASGIAKETLRHYPEHPLSLRHLAASLAQSGHLDEAREILKRAMSLYPNFFDMFVRRRAPWVPLASYEHMLEGLRKAGWEG
jgi:adenylate cyclase